MAQTCFSDLIQEIRRDFGKASGDLASARIPKQLKPPTGKDELKKQYWEVNGLRSKLVSHKFTVERRLAQIQTLSKNSSEIQKLLTTSSEGAMESIVKETIAYNFNSGSSNGIKWSIDARVEQAKQELKGLYQSYKDLPGKFEAPAKKLKELLDPLEPQLQWHEKNALTDGAASIASTVWGFGSELISKQLNRKNQ